MKRKWMLVCMLICATLVMAGCEKQKSEYTPDGKYQYNDVQDNKTTEISSNQNGERTELVAVADEKQETTDTKQEIPESENVQSHSIENTVNAQIPPITQDIHIAETPQVHIDQSQFAADSATTTETVETTMEGTMPTTGQQPLQDNIGGSEGQTGVPGASPTDATSEGNIPGGTNDGSQDAGNGDGTGEEGGTEIGPPDTTEEPQKTGKIVNLYSEGTLGTYIWGQPADTSELHIFVEYEDGRKEEVTDYTIDMGYPDRENRKAPSNIANEWVRCCHDILYGSKNNISDYITEKNYFYNWYTPGIYNATVEYQNNTIEVPYTLNIMAVLVYWNEFTVCSNTEEHLRVFRVTTMPWANIYCCDSFDYKEYTYKHGIAEVSRVENLCRGDAWPNAYAVSYGQDMVTYQDFVDVGLFELGKVSNVEYKGDVRVSLNQAESLGWGEYMYFVGMTEFLCTIQEDDWIPCYKKYLGINDNP